MKQMGYRKPVSMVLIAGLGYTLAACGGGGEGPIVPPPPAPPEYADQHMPEGWWADEKIIEEGRQIYLGKHNIDVNCSSCHGREGKPVKAGARDFRTTERMKLYSDSVWFWRVSEGVPNTKMKAWKSKLTEEDRWKVIAFERTFGLDGMEYDVVKKQWVPIGTAAKTAEAGAAKKDGVGNGASAKQAKDASSAGKPATTGSN